MKVVLDTNVLVSGLYTPGGLCSQVLRLVRTRVLTCCVDARMLVEYEEVLHQLDPPVPRAEADELCRILRNAAAMVEPPPLVTSLPHWDDVPFLEVAKASGAILVTGNKRHFPKRQCAGVAVMSPRELLDYLHRPH
ncbi:MAG TPA: putative toxin-antitoxin system toxin component, PIN family [Phycisphaerae bacterium]|nr:putative toxin-antitoxin system toxin component, PIN family [Phycisphaerae bacterium]